MTDFETVYDVPRVPGLQVGVTADGRVDQMHIYRELYRPAEITPALLADAVTAYKLQTRGPAANTRRGGERNGMIAALTAAGLYEPEYLEAALRAYRHGYHGDEGSMRQALEAVLEVARS
jgi:hypothetical protein